MSKASDFLHDYCLFIPDCYKAPYTKVGPGGMIEKMSPENRELIKTLKSEDLQNVRPDSCYMFQHVGRGRWGRLKAEQANAEMRRALHERIYKR